MLELTPGLFGRESERKLRHTLTGLNLACGKESDNIWESCKKVEKLSETIFLVLKTQGMVIFV